MFSLYIDDISTDIDSEIRLFADDCLCYQEIKNTEERGHIETSERYRSTGMLGKEMEYGFQPVKCNMIQITRKRSMLYIYSGGNSP